eukprot:scaffold27420_cov52-Phaeocystis_antarctica.AAC.3
MTEGGRRRAAQWRRVARLSERTSDRTSRSLQKAATPSDADPSTQARQRGGDGRGLRTNPLPTPSNAARHDRRRRRPRSR